MKCYVCEQKIKGLAEHSKDGPRHMGCVPMTQVEIPLVRKDHDETDNLPRT
jgi:hypothetical protein